MNGDTNSLNPRRAAFALKQHTVLSRSGRIFDELVDNESLSEHEITAMQRERAAAHARYAMENTAFYRDYYSAAGFVPADLLDPDAFDELPIVEKQHVRDHFEQFKTPEATDRTAVVTMTGGSTGEPLHLLRDKRVSAQPLEWRLFRWWGVHPSDHIAIVWRHYKTGRERMVHAAQWWPSKRIQLDAYRINESTVREFAARWSRVRPTLFTGYAGGVLEFARTIERIGEHLPAPVAVATTASPLTEENRIEVEQILQAPVYDHYRSAEIPWMGGECRERSGHHIFADARVVEVVDHTGRAVRDQVGYVVATDLTNRVFPLIRYRLGDRTKTIEVPCACGVALPRIDHVIGKEGDGLRLPDGTWIATEAIYTLFSKQPSAVKQFQVHQGSDHSVYIRCVLGASPDAVVLAEEIVEGLRERLDRAVPVTWEHVDEIRHDGGKIRYVTSEVR